METEKPDKASKGNGLELVNLEPLTRTGDDGQIIMEDCDIPEWLLMEVLIRLPAMLVCRFKLVSKQWLSILSDPFFVHRNNIFQASLLPQPWTIVSSVMLMEGSHYSNFSNNGLLENIHSQPFKPRYCALPLPSTQTYLSGERYRVFAVSNGLVLYGLPRCGMHNTVVWICNPITGQWIPLPPFKCFYSYVGYGFLTHVEDGILKSFRVVRLNLSTRKQDNLKVEVFFSETGDWKHFFLSDGEITFGFQREGTNLNGVLHWISCEHGIIAYDPYQNPKSKRMIAFPHDIIDREDQNARYTMCVAYQGKLRLIEVDDSNRCPDPFSSFKIWVLDDYNSEDWCLQHEVSYKNIQYDVNLFSEGMFFVPLCFHPFDSDIVFFASDDAFISYSVKTRKIEVEQEFFGNVRIEYPWQWSFLFTIPPWPVSIPHT